ncbi:non-heme iron oxygenase ferredoxin subunit [Marinobacter sp. NP-6]|uniref:non-heme iron oxygenase ferredoxin subunit n=1 Tax=Marinobacter sp. NP-6 TaxID=2488666 RepID=UPI000FCC0126|nr:non-heme iron oxygenase ferredoxin subunit [Marinobacter sp. NP-6]RUT76976.1 non-heme iron oxygenase ferredoxin subunit [Marinobacter sp. NP-6]
MNQQLITTDSSENIVPICLVSDVEPGEVIQAELSDGHQLAVYNLEGVIYVTDDKCTHGDASLSEDGMVEGDEVECTWHFGRFDIRTGKACAMPCTVPLKTWVVRVKGDQVYVEDDR